MAGLNGIGNQTNRQAPIAKPVVPGAVEAPVKKLDASVADTKITLDATATKGAIALTAVGSAKVAPVLSETLAASAAMPTDETKGTPEQA